MNFPGPRGAAWCGPNADCNEQRVIAACEERTKRAEAAYTKMREREEDDKEFFKGEFPAAPEVVSLFDLRRSALALAIDWGGSGDNVDDLLATADDICDWLTRPLDDSTD